ncbi:MAG TPA: hypothetical protein VNQ80_00295 [Parapedobacter sp.]|uniref:hypothetical protein n=1 Tax=Parapedobacter sp. TaxID=1958893 RepID=UPI002C066E87|nr:hypothetical protein [Parapedobacter sp.]HWK55739.1 hypothetical protein [Parapedobacter sp.]
MISIVRIVVDPVDVSLREWTLYIDNVFGNTHVGNYIPAETGCLWFIGTGAAAYTYAAGDRPTAL